jgi:hypothetical protein
MSPEQRLLLTLVVLPGRLSVEQTAWYLGFQPHEIPVLVAAKFLKPLGHPAVSGVKYFATAQLSRLREDQRWLERASDAIVNFWKVKNGRRKNHPERDASAAA